jgi:ubiquinone/menaquinone biosynthesis C-methylase UbiE
MAVDYAEQKDYWESIGKRRTPNHAAVKAFSTSKLKFVTKSLPPTDRARTMLEVGAGNGYFSVPFSHAFELTALDFSEAMLAQNPLPEDRKIQGDAEHLPYDDDSFDVVLCGNLLHHLEDPLVAVKEMKRVARDHVVLIEPNAFNPLMFAFGAIVKEERGTLKFFSPYVKKLGRDAGMKLRAYASQGTVLPNKTPLSLLPLIKPLERSHPLGFYHVAVFDV